MTLLALIDRLKGRHRNLATLSATIRDRLIPEAIRTTEAAEDWLTKFGETRWWACVVYAYEVMPVEGTGVDALATWLANAECYGLSRKDFTQAIRIALTGSVVSEPLEEVVENIGYAKARHHLHRLVA